MLRIFFVITSCAYASGWITGIQEEFNALFRKSRFFSGPETDYEVIYPKNGIGLLESEILYDLNAFGSVINLRLEPNLHLMSPNFQAVVKNGDDIREIETGSRRGSCYYLHKDETLVAAFNLCEENAMEGFVFLPNETLEIYPVRNGRDGSSGRIPHIVRKANYKLNPFLDDAIYADIDTNASTFMDQPRLSFSGTGLFQRRKRTLPKSQKLTIETALFLDEPGYKIFAPFFEFKDESLCNMLLAYINAVQALYHHPSLGQPINIALVKLEIFKKQPADLPHFEGERNQLLDSFCLYNEKHNPKGDKDPSHWDMGLYVSGLNFFAYENGRRSDVTMGLATVSGVCTEKYNCIIAEFGTTNVFGKPYPSAGFTSVYVLAHEMGHNLGMHHDSTGNNCPREGYIMSPSRGTNGETLWSPCSADVATAISQKCLYDAPERSERKLDHTKFTDNPGEIWRAKMQCEVLIRDHDADLYNPDKLEDICENLQCKTPHRSGFYMSGPALQGTECGKNKWCQGGKCVARVEKPKNVVKGGWSDWVPVGKCASGCIQKSRGYQLRRRNCDNPKPVNTDEGCEGEAFDVSLCKEDKNCKKKISAEDYATEKCKAFSKILPDLESKAIGLQATHESGRLWMACAIFCKRKDTKMYYTPRLELNDLGSDPYFPDGTWCHNDGIMDYYCIQHHCLPENFKYAKGAIAGEDVELPQNAVPKTKSLPKEILQYFGLDLNGKPLLTTLAPEKITPAQEDEWTDKDYLEISDLVF